MEELLELDVMWPENEDRPINIEQNPDDLVRYEASPVNIPKPAGSSPVSVSVSVSVSDSESESESEEMVPPHVLVSRRWSVPSSVASSLCSGAGRTLKGRDLRNLRDFVLEITGFFGA